MPSSSSSKIERRSIASRAANSNSRLAISEGRRGREVIRAGSFVLDALKFGCKRDQIYYAGEKSHTHAPVISRVTVAAVRASTPPETLNPVTYAANVHVVLFA